MSQHDDFNPPKQAPDGDLSATVPDIFASMAKSADLPPEFTVVKVNNSGSMRLPGEWEQQRAGLRSLSVSFKRKDSYSSELTVGPLEVEKRSETLIKSLCEKGARTLQDFEISSLQAALADIHRPDKFEISAGSTEVLRGRVVLVVQGDLQREQIKEAIVIFPERVGFGQLLFKAIKPEFSIYFDHLRLGLQTLEWN